MSSDGQAVEDPSPVAAEGDTEVGTAAPESLNEQVPDLALEAGPTLDNGKQNAAGFQDIIVSDRPCVDRV